MFIMKQSEEKNKNSTIPVTIATVGIILYIVGMILAYYTLSIIGLLLIITPVFYKLTQNKS